MIAIRLIICGVVCASAVAQAADVTGPPPPPTAVETPPAVSARQIADDRLEKFEPKVPLTEEDQAEARALSWYMTGQIREGRNDYAGALDAYRKAVEVAPRELPAYQSLVTISFAQGNRDEARKYAIQAARQTRKGIQLARGLANLLSRTSHTQQAIDVLEEVRQSPPKDIKPVDELVLHRDLGAYHRLLLNIDEAVDHYRKVMAALEDADSPLSEEDRETLLGDASTTYEEMGKTFLDAKLADLAVKAFDQASQHGDARPEIHSFNLATVYKETGRPEKALAELEKYFHAQLQSKGREAYELLAQLLNDLGRSDELVTRLENLHEKDTRNKTLSYFLAEQYESQGQLEQAEALFKETIGSTNDPRGLVGLASVHRRQHDAKPLLETYSKAFQILERVLSQAEEAEIRERMDADTRAVVDRFGALEEEITKDEQTMDALVAYGNELAADENANLDFIQIYLLGKLSAEAERIDAAKQFYQLAIDMQNEPPAQLFREMGLALVEAERYQEAADVFQQAIEHESRQLQAAPVRSVFLYLQSHALEMAGKTDAALEAIQAAQQARPGVPGMEFQEAWIYYHARRWQDAVAAFEQLIQTFESSDDPDTQQVVRNARFSLSAVYVQLDNFEKGEDILLKVLEKEPDHPQVNNDLGYLWADQGKNLEQARAMIEKALAAEPDNPAYIDSMGWVLFKLGEYERALEHLEKAVKLERGEDSTIWDHLGDTYEKLGRHEKAQEAWQKALELEQAKNHPDEKIVNRIQEKLPAAPAGAATE